MRSSAFSVRGIGAMTLCTLGPVATGHVRCRGHVRIQTALRSQVGAAPRTAAVCEVKGFRLKGQLVVRSQSEPSLQRPQSPTPPVQRPSLPELPQEERAEETEGAEDAPASAAVETETETTCTRRQARALTQYFESLKLQEIKKQPAFGWTPNNEIGNGRWVMFGILVGLLTEYATGVNMIDQLKLIVSNLGIADIYD